MKMEHWLTPYQVSLRLKVDPNTVLGYIRDGKLKATHLSGGNIPYVHHDEFNRFLAEDWPLLSHPTHPVSQSTTGAMEPQAQMPPPYENRVSLLQRTFRRIKGRRSSRDSR